MYYHLEVNFKPEEVLDYLRKSRSDDPLLTVEEVLSKHETILDEWAEKHLGAKVPEENKYREVVSGETIADRPEMQTVLKLIESPLIKAILVVEVQRLSRGDLEDAGRLIKLLRYTNTMVITPQKTYDLRDEYDRDMFERELKRGNEFLEYQKRIMNRGTILSVEQGNYLGSIPPYGYDKTTVLDGKRKCPTLKINEEEAAVVRMIFDMYVNEDMGRATIAKHLNALGIKPRKSALWAQDAIKGILENEHLIGKVRRNWRKNINVVEDGEIRKTRPKAKPGDYLLCEGRHEPIISEELFYAAREKQGRNHKAKPSTKIRNPFASLVYCQCGRAMTLRTYVKDGKERSAPRLICDNQSYCHTTSCLYDEMLDRISNILENCVRDFEVRIQNNNEDSVKAHANMIKRLKAKLDELEKKEISQWEKYSEEGMPKAIFDTLNEKVKREKEETQKALLDATKAAPVTVNYEKTLYIFRDALDALKNPDVSAAQKNRLLKACIQRIDYYRGKAVRVTTEMAGKGVLPVGGTWQSGEIELDVKLRL